VLHGKQARTRRDPGASSEPECVLEEGRRRRNVRGDGEGTPRGDPRALTGGFDSPGAAGHLWTRHRSGGRSAGVGYPRGGDLDPVERRSPRGSRRAATL
ncbi:MAG: hypothetical protein AVDCRST_MAG78-425, partial [uncultured Rubrobacteraceae bacterium]